MKRIITLILPIILSAQIATGQKNQPVDDSYRRSSICMILMDEAGMPKRDLIISSFMEQPVPDKYNDHNTRIRVFDPDAMTVTEIDREAYKQAILAAFEGNDGDGKGKKKKGGGGFGKFMKSAASVAVATAAGQDQSTMLDTSNKEEYAIKAYKHLLEEAVAKQLFDTWFLNSDGEFCMDLIQERGMYDATVMDVQNAKNSVRGMNLLADAGEELINNTFVVVSRYRYISKEELQKELEATANAVGSLFGGIGELAASAASTASQIGMGSGYFVRVTSFLFQLNWNEEVQHTFYNTLWDNHRDYHASDIFSLKYIGEETAFANVKAGIFSNKAEEELIQIATINATDEVLAKLEKKYDVFKTKTPLLTVEPQITASIGMKEGLTPGDRYEVLEKIVDSETGKTTYKRKTTLKVAKDGVWDNRYMASEEREALGEEDSGLTATVFEGSSNGLYPGMLLRQIK